MSPALAGADTSVFAAALDWLSAILLGTLGSIIAMLAVASLGILMLAGRIDLRRAGQAIFGCFILFGASTIAIGLMSALHGTGVQIETAAAEAPMPAYPPAPPIAQGSPSAFDPYAGAALPAR